MSRLWSLRGSFVQASIGGVSDFNRVDVKVFVNLAEQGFKQVYCDDFTLPGVSLGPGRDVAQFLCTSRNKDEYLVLLEMGGSPLCKVEVDVVAAFVHVGRTERAISFAARKHDGVAVRGVVVNGDVVRFKESTAAWTSFTRT